MEIAVIIINYNLAQYTIECVQSILNSNFSPITIILVDNGSSEADYQFLKTELSEISVIRIPHNIECAGGLNVGIRRALETQATHIFIINNDTIVDASALRHLVESGWDVAVPKILYFDYPDIIWSAGARWRVLPPMVVVRGNRRHDDSKYDTPCRLEYATGCAFLARREVFEKLEGFDEAFGCYQEDYEFFYRVKAQGYQTGYVPEARILHRVSLTLGKFPASRRLMQARNMVHFYLKDNRFHRIQLYLYMAWVMMRETIKGNLSHLPNYWQGFREGLKVWGSKSS